MPRTAKQPLHTTDIPLEVLAAISLIKKRERRTAKPPHVAEFAQQIKILSDDPIKPELIPFAGWGHQVDRFEAWERGESEIILKARQLGMSEAIVIYSLYRAMYSGWRVALLSAGQREARELLVRCRRAWYSLPVNKRGIVNWRTDDAEFDSGGRIMALPSSEDAGVSYTFQLAIMDELAFHPWGESNYAALRPTLSAGGQFIALSTANPRLGPSGLFHDLYFASKNGETPYNSIFIPWDARPGRDQDWLSVERAAYTGMPEEFDAYYPDTEDDAFVARQGLVFPQFDKSKHVAPPKIDLDHCVRVVAGVDFGGGDPTAIVILGMDKDHHVHQYAEFYRPGTVGVDQLIQFLSQYRVDTVVCDPTEPVAISTLKAQGIPAMAADNRRGEGLGMVAFLLENDRLTIDPTCQNSIGEFPGYRWSDRTDPNDRSRYSTKTPVNHHADAMDARRYAIMELSWAIRGVTKMPSRTLSGRPLRRVAV